MASMLGGAEDLGYASDLDRDADMLRSQLGDMLDEPDRYEIFMPAVQSLVNALGGYEEIETAPGSGKYETVYRPGDSVLAVLKDLKKLWRKDDSDDERTVARCMLKAGLMKELISLVVECTDRGDWGRKVALVACESRNLVTRIRGADSRRPDRCADLAHRCHARAQGDGGRARRDHGLRQSAARTG